MRWYYIREVLPGRPYVAAETTNPLWLEGHAHVGDDLLTEDEINGRPEFREALVAWREANDREMAREEALEFLGSIEIPAVTEFEFPVVDVAERYSDEPACKAVLETVDAVRLITRALEAQPVRRQLAELQQVVSRSRRRCWTTSPRSGDPRRKQPQHRSAERGGAVASLDGPSFVARSE